MSENDKEIAKEFMKRWGKYAETDERIEQIIKQLMSVPGISYDDAKSLFDAGFSFSTMKTASLQELVKIIPYEKATGIIEFFSPRKGKEVLAVKQKTLISPGVEERVDVVTKNDESLKNDLLELERELEGVKSKFDARRFFPKKVLLAAKLGPTAQPMTPSVERISVKSILDTELKKLDEDIEKLVGEKPQKPESKPPIKQPPTKVPLRETSCPCFKGI